MSEDCPDFDETLRTMLDTPPVNRARNPKPQDDGDDQIEAGEGESEDGK